MFGFGQGAILDYHHQKSQLLSPESIPEECETIKKIAVGNINSCVLLSNGTVCEYKQETDGAKVTKKEILEDIKIVDIFAGSEHMFAVDEHNILYAWGLNYHRQLGILEDEAVLIPIQVSRFTSKKVVQVACGESHSLILLKFGEVFAMGDNKYGQLGIGNESPVNEPKQINSLVGFPIQQLVAGGWHSFCITISGRVFSWGRNDYGQLGLGDGSNHASSTLMEFSTEHPVSCISAGDCHSAVLTRDGAMFTFGLNESGQLGHHNLESHFSPKLVQEFEGSIITHIACGRNHTVAYIHGCRQIFTFGNGEYGQLGLGKVMDKVTEPQIVKGPWSYSADGNPAINIVKLCSAGNQVYVFTSKSSDVIPSTVQSVGDCSVAKFETMFCKAFDMENEEDIISVIRSKSCWNASFADQDKVTNFDYHGIKLELASETLHMMSICKFKTTIVNHLCDTIQSLDTDLQDVDALRIYIIMPMFLMCLEKSSQELEIVNCFLVKFSQIKPDVWELLERWYKSSEATFVTIVKICKEVVLNSLVNNLSIPSQTVKDVLVKLHNLNDLYRITDYKEFYLALPSQFVEKNLHLVESLLYRLQCSFLGGAKTKATFLMESAKARLSKADRQLFLRDFFSQFVSVRGQDPKISLYVNRSSLVEDSIQQLDNIENLSRPIYVFFQGDDDAVSKEYFMLIIPELLKKYELFSEIEDSNCVWFSSKYTDSKQPLYNLLGKLCGIAIYNSTVVDVNFPLVLYKKLLGHKLGFDDFMELEPVFANSLKQILDFEEQDELTVEETFGMAFELSDGTQLKPDGKNLPVTSANREEYVELCVDYILNKSVERQFNAFKEGFLKACPEKIIEIFHPKELMEMVVGKQDINLEEARQFVVINYRSLNSQHLFDQVVKWFWEVLSDFWAEEKNRFLLFVTASNKIPLCGLKFTIQETDAVDVFMPIAITCYNILYLPRYSSKEILENRLKLAIQSSGFHMKN